jgi:hypothetical protein
MIEDIGNQEEDKFDGDDEKDGEEDMEENN